MLVDAADRLDAGGARELLDLGQLLVGVRSLRPAPRARSRAPAPVRVSRERGIIGRLCPCGLPDRSRDPHARARRHRVAVARGGAAVRLRRRRSVPLDARLRRRRVGALRQAAAASRSCCSPGHTDTVPEQGNLPGRIEDGWVHGLGATDMKGGLAVMIELARWAAERRARLRPRRCSSSRARSSARQHNPLPGVFEAAPLVDEAALVICLEPTDNTLQLGCLGNLNARRRLRGRVGALGTAVAGRERDQGSRSRGCATSLELEPRDVDRRRPALPRGAVA